MQERSPPPAENSKLDETFAIIIAEGWGVNCFATGKDPSFQKKKVSEGKILHPSQTDHDAAGRFKNFSEEKEGEKGGFCFFDFA